jgi:uncharacterized protein (TIGR02452 family)
MIKRSDGVEVMNARTKNVSIAKETIEILKHKRYTSANDKSVDISQSLDAAVKGTVLYKNGSDLPDTDWETLVPVIEVVNETTAQAAVRLADQPNLVGLNFASARNPGGGFLAGSLAQEEDLCRCSGLYSCIKSKPIFYNENILSPDTLYTDNIIYSPKVPFFRDEYYFFLETPFELSIITCPAPNISSMKTPKSWQEDEELAATLDTVLFRRATKILEVAAAHGHKNIILGAWGCGAFGNDPKQVAKAFKEALTKVPAFEHVCFAVYDTRQPPHLFDTFKEVFNG